MTGYLLPKRARVVVDVHVATPMRVKDFVYTVQATMRDGIAARRNLDGGVAEIRMRACTSYQRVVAHETAPLKDRVREAEQALATIKDLCTKAFARGTPDTLSAEHVLRAIEAYTNHHLMGAFPDPSETKTEESL
jgi:hypothetical protein